jgi:hypothetical protein
VIVFVPVLCNAPLPLTPVPVILKASAVLMLLLKINLPPLLTVVPASVVPRALALAAIKVAPLTTVVVLV